MKGAVILLANPNSLTGSDGRARGATNSCYVDTFVLLEARSRSLTMRLDILLEIANPTSLKD